MKGLIFSITAGQGHNQTARVMSEYFNSIGVECPYMDVFEYINPILSESVSKIYLMSAKKMPQIYGKVYSHCEKRPIIEEQHPLPKVTTNILGRTLIGLIEKEKPDFIICTHVFAALLVTYLNENIAKMPKTIGIVTDFTIHPYWEDTCLDYYVVASDAIINQGVKKGIPAEKFKAIGIPIAEKFGKKLSKKDAAEALGIPERDTILVMSGSMGFGKIVDEIVALDKLERDFQIVTICGNNEKLKKKIDALKMQKSVYNYGYVDNVDIFMDVADCIVTKPGGLTTSEALAKGLPMIMNNPVPGQEDRNVEFLLNAGVAMKVSRTYPIDDVVNQMFLDERRTQLAEAGRRLGKPTATRDLAEFIMGIV